MSTWAAGARCRHLFGLALLVASVATLFAAPQALAHAQLIGTSPAAGTTVEVQPQQVIFEFNQNVGGTLGAVRVYNAQGAEVDNLAVSHPNGNEHWMGVGLKPGLPDGTYTATYRVVSADTHIVYGGLVFDLGYAGAAPRYSVAGLIGKSETGKVTKLVFGVVRTLSYLAIAVLVGGLAFLLAAWLPGFNAVAGPQSEWDTAAEQFAARFRRLLLSAIAVGLVMSVLGVLLQGASAAGVSLWSSVKATVIESTMESRFGRVWALRALDWLLLGALILVATRGGRLSARTQVASGEGTPGRLSAPPRGVLAMLLVCAAYLAVSPALSGHPSIQGPTVVFFPASVLHVLAASVWVGGIACMLLALPAATGQLAAPDRSRMLLATLIRFSPLALASVVVIAATGVVQAYIDVRSINALFHSTYGALIIAKTLLLLVLIGLGWVNRARVIPRLQELAGAGAPPRGTGIAARRTMRAELTLMTVVFGVTAALVTYAPPIDAASGPFSATTRLGPAVLEMTVEPARVGSNTIHLYLIDAKSGAQYTATKELTATAKLPSKDIGPLQLHPTVAGPGHFVFNSAVLSPGGTWEIEINDRVSEFESFSRTVRVPVG